ncbi:MAG: Rrf2 family cysteine metabolism transcriptional repressor [Candidatus Latescibacterota bacterium]|jgi:Rrf2 family cysteine metabolism transcriptional repressor
MHISAKGNYGLRAVLDLALHYGQGSILSADIAARQQIPEAYLVQLLNLLGKAGLIRSMRGPKGGHQLLKRPEEVCVGEVLAALEGPVDLLGKGDLRTQEGAEVDVLRDIWLAVENAINDVLSAVTFADLCKKQRKQQANFVFRI